MLTAFWLHLHTHRHELEILAELNLDLDELDCPPGQFETLHRGDRVHHSSYKTQISDKKSGAFCLSHEQEVALLPLLVWNPGFISQLSFAFTLRETFQQVFIHWFIHFLINYYLFYWRINKVLFNLSVCFCCLFSFFLISENLRPLRLQLWNSVFELNKNKHWYFFTERVVGSSPRLAQNSGLEKEGDFHLCAWQ